jgi:NAD(P)-dependent dehydrogenase (short-subunit alcohol dehydrogenase family)
MSSVAGLMGAATAGAYTASKHGVIALTKTAALEYGDKGIRVKASCPAVIETAMAERLFGDAEVQRHLRSQHALGRFGKPMEIAEGVLWMCSDRSSFMTGQYLVLDGGFLAGPHGPLQ